MQGKSRYMEADVSKVVDNSNPMKARNVQLKYPIRIRVRKSPVLIHFDMHKVAVSQGSEECETVGSHDVVSDIQPSSTRDYEEEEKVQGGLVCKDSSAWLWKTVYPNRTKNI